MTDLGHEAWEPCPAYPQLHALACEMRPDWGADDLHDAMTAAFNAGWPWKSVYKEVMRLAWAESETLDTLRISARKPGAVPAVPLSPARKAALLADLTRRTGPQPRLAEDNDRRDPA